MLFSATLFGQSVRQDSTGAVLDSLAKQVEGLNEEVSFSVSGLPLEEFFRAIAKKHELNVTIEGELQTPISNNFTDATVLDVFKYLLAAYDLEYRVTGSIIAVSRYVPPPPPVVIELRKYPDISKDSISGTLTMDLNRDSVSSVCRRITELFGVNVLYVPQIAERRLTAYIQDVPLEPALEKMALLNNMEVVTTPDSFFILQPVESNQSIGQRIAGRQSRQVLFEILDAGSYHLSAKQVDITDVLLAISDKTELEFYFYDQPTGMVNIDMYSVSIKDFFNTMFKGSNYTYLHNEGRYYFGRADHKALSENRRIHLLHRSVEGLSQFIPNELKTNLEIIEFPEMNSLMVSGPYPIVEEFHAFIGTIDLTVPLVQIEVMIVDYDRNSNVEGGIQMGIGSQPTQSRGALYPGLDYQMGASSVNRLLNSFNGFGALNLGPVTPNFYLSIRALETNGVIDVRSTPRLATLNGHEATIGIRNQEYYLVENSTVSGGLNPTPVVTRNYNSVNADFELSIKPYLSGEGQVTLEITVKQGDFTTRIAPDAPPGQVTRTFTSLVRVKDGEMILLGGLETDSNEETGEGLPLLSRIPVLKWLFGTQSHIKKDTRLNIFIKPTIYE